jgi:hypothetical protein
MELIDQIVRAKAAVEAELLALPGVTGVDVGYKEVGGRLTDQISVRVHVAKKRDRVPAAERVPKEIDGYPTDVLERTYELQVVEQSVDVGALADTTHYSTLQGGVSMGPSRVINGSIFAGTLGAIVIDNVTNRHAALTNFHVACVDAGWHVGDRMVQPSRIDTGVPPTDEFGAIVRATLSANVDGALVSIDPTKTSSCTIAEIGNVAGTKAATLGMAVRKRGRTTGLTYGSVDGLSATVNVNYGSSIGTRTLTNQISIRTDTGRNPLFSDHGDSGSVIVDQNGFVVGLLFAGAGTNTIANPIAVVLSELNISMCTGRTKSVIKDIRDKVIIKERVKDGVKDSVKDRVKDTIKDSIKDRIKDTKELVRDKALLKDAIKDRTKDAIKDSKEFAFENPGQFPGGGGDPGWRQPGLPGGLTSSLDERLGALEEQLATLTSFIAGDLRPDLTGGAFVGAGATGADDGGDEELDAIRAQLEQQVADAAQAKAEFDGRFQ